MSGDGFRHGAAPVAGEAATMKPEDQRAFVADGHSAARRDNFRAADDAARAWGRGHLMLLADYLALRESVQATFGPFPVDHTPWQGKDFRL